MTSSSAPRGVTTRRFDAERTWAFAALTDTRAIPTPNTRLDITRWTKVAVASMPSSYGKRVLFERQVARPAADSDGQGSMLTESGIAQPWSESNSSRFSPSRMRRSSRVIAAVLAPV
jgi:hypothetical protein